MHECAILSNYTTVLFEAETQHWVSLCRFSCNKSKIVRQHSTRHWTPLSIWHLPRENDNENNKEYEDYGAAYWTHDPQQVCSILLHLDTVNHGSCHVGMQRFGVRRVRVFLFNIIQITSREFLLLLYLFFFFLGRRLIKHINCKVSGDKEIWFYAFEIITVILAKSKHNIILLLIRYHWNYLHCWKCTPGQTLCTTAFLAMVCCDILQFPDWNHRLI